MSDFAIEASDVRKSFKTGDFELSVLNGVDFSLQKGEFVSIQGESGSGKTTFLNVISGLENPDSGYVKWGGEEIANLGRDALARKRGQYMGIVFQSYHLVQEIDSLQNVLMSYRIAKGSPDKKAVDRAKALMERVGLGDRCRQMPDTLSGGERQRVAIARALLTDPLVILADEPTGNLDERTGNSVMELLQELCRERGVALALVTHNISHAAKADRSLTLTKGSFTEPDFDPKEQENE